jgi:putative phosphoesterase
VKPTEEGAAAPGLRVGVVADTHVPDRVNALHPGLLPALRAASVQRIFHLGDVSTNRVLDELSQVAPVETVRGNRDWLLTPLPPWERCLELGGVRLVVVHGQGNFFHYWLEKVRYVVQGYDFGRYQRRLTRAFPHGQVYLFGHSHHPVDQWVDGRLFFNPGSASANFASALKTPSFGLLQLMPQQPPRAEIVPLEGWRLVRGAWLPEETGKAE